MSNHLSEYRIERAKYRILYNGFFYRLQKRHRWCGWSTIGGGFGTIHEWNGIRHVRRYIALKIRYHIRARHHSKAFWKIV